MTKGVLLRFFIVQISTLKSHIAELEKEVTDMQVALTTSENMYAVLFLRCIKR